MALDCTIAFVDLAGFTALTEAHGDKQAADLAERFLELARNALGRSHRLVKVIGDAVMFASGSAVDGTDFWFCSLTCAATFAADPGKYAHTH
jgi:class 3 adenylate cyclase